MPHSAHSPAAASFAILLGMKSVYLGIDVGYSAKRKSTGVCVIEPDAREPVRCEHVKTQDTPDAILKLLAGAEPIAASIDGPLVASALSDAERYITVNRYRRCDEMLSRGLFQKRCKPGQTNSPVGQKLHDRATVLANHVLSLFPHATISESFPNAFMGVMLPDATTWTIPRGKKSDAFWNYCIGPSTVLERLISHLLGADGAKVFDSCRLLRNHDERAAVICALTAAAARQGQGFLVDGGADGTIVLPPEQFIQPWATEALKGR